MASFKTNCPAHFLKKWNNVHHACNKFRMQFRPNTDTSLGVEASDAVEPVWFWINSVIICNNCKEGL